MHNKILPCLQIHDIQLLQGTNTLPSLCSVVVMVEAGNKAICLHFVCSPPPLPSLFHTFTACDLVSLGNVAVPGPGSDALMAQAVQQMKSLELSTMRIVTFKASMESIIFTDNVNGYV